MICRSDIGRTHGSAPTIGRLRHFRNFNSFSNMKSQLRISVLLVIFGVILLIAAFIVPPTGVIDPTVLTAFGEILTFAGAIIGIDYHHRVKE